jgi:protein Tex
MGQFHFEKIATELRLTLKQVQATATLLDQGATVPFIARYRKEATASLDEVELTTIRDRLAQLRELSQRQNAILNSLEERGLLTEDLRQSVLAAESMTALEDIYLPYRPKRRTRATIAREKGLEPLARLLWDQGDIDPVREAAAYVDPKGAIETPEEALAGARDIIAEWVSEDATARAQLRELFLSQGILISCVAKGKEDLASKYRDYHNWEESVATAPSHRVLAMMRGEAESMLTLHIHPPEELGLSILEGLFVRGLKPASLQVQLAVNDSYKRLLVPSLETDVRHLIKERADAAAIQVFADNLRQLLLAPPLGNKNVMALDPGFRTGCKVVCLDRQGRLLHRDTVYPLLDAGRATEAAKKLVDLCRRFHVEAIAVGNGTGGRETEVFVRGLDLGPDVSVVMVNESGASVYSASEVARAEFPDEDVTVRGAISIGRRLMDPLAELIKIDPKSIGVGQYQHDVDQKALKGRLDDVVVSCVNAVGVELNTASAELLSHVSGLGPRLARTIVEYRNEHGPVRSRQALKKVPRLGPKAFEQAAGFLRIRDGENPLDASAVHPESYHIVEAIARDLGCSVKNLIGDAGVRSRVNLGGYVNDSVGLPTLNDIMDELARPGRDPRQELESFSFAEGVQKIEDLTPGMRLPGGVTNVTVFGAFVDIGVHQDGLVHVSQLADRFVRNPGDVVKVQQRVMVTVLGVDLERRRISLSMKTNPTVPEQASPG